MGYQQEKGRDYFESFPPTRLHSTIRLVQHSGFLSSDSFQ